MDNEYLSGLYSNVDGNTAISLSGGFGVPVPTGPGVPDGLSVQPMRHRRSGLEQSLLMAKDVFDSISGVDPNAYLGKTAELANRYDTTRMEEDPEGKAVDYNRAKILSQRAYATKDPEMKKKYGAVIKRLLPRETQGLDDLTASEFLISSEKMEIEKLKAATQLAKEKMKGEYSLEKTDKQNENKITIQDMKNAATQEHDVLQYDLKMALADKDYEKAVMIRDRMDELEQFKKAVDEKFDKLNVDATHRRLDSFKINLADMESKGEGKLADERKRLLRQYDKLKNDIAVSENNICFFSAKSKKAEKLLTDMERKIASLKEELKLIETKINLIDEKFD